MTNIAPVQCQEAAPKKIAGKAIGITYIGLKVGGPVPLMVTAFLAFIGDVQQ
jgi:hypothetical protein